MKRKAAAVLMLAAGLAAGAWSVCAYAAAAQLEGLQQPAASGREVQPSADLEKTGYPAASAEEERAAVNLEKTGYPAAGAEEAEAAGDLERTVQPEVREEKLQPSADLEKTGEPAVSAEGAENSQDADRDIRIQTDDLISDLGLDKIDSYVKRENAGGITFSELVRELMGNGLSLDFAAAGKKLNEAVLQDYSENRAMLIQVLILVIAFSVLIQMTSALPKSYIPDLGFLGVYLIVMLLLLKLFLITAGTAESYLSKLTEFMQLLMPAFCMSMVFSNGSISAGAYYELLLLLIYLVNLVFVKILLPAVQIYMVLQLVNHLTEERFSRIASLMSDSVNWCIKILMSAMIGLNIVQGLLAPGIDGLKRSTIAEAVRAVPGAGQIMNSMTQMLAGSAMLVKNSVGAAALAVLVSVSFLPLLKVSVFMLLYRGCAAFMEPVSDKRFCAAVSALGQSAALCLKLMFYAALLFFLTTAVICASTTFAV